MAESKDSYYENIDGWNVKITRTNEVKDIRKEIVALIRDIHNFGIDKIKREEKSR